jgi:hypothetical protein
VSGAPKLKAITLVAELEKERRGSYAGSVGRFNFEESAMDTCIAIRTMVAKDGVIYLQAGGGIVHDSVEEDEYVETLNKLKANVTCIESAEGGPSTSPRFLFCVIHPANSPSIFPLAFSRSIRLLLQSARTVESCETSFVTLRLGIQLYIFYWLF